MEAKDAFDAGKQAGMKEVVDSLDWESTPLQTMSGSPIMRLEISEEDWQGKLKEWGLEVGNGS